MDFKERIKQRRLELNLTTDDVAKIVGVSNATISRWETGAIENQRRDKIALLARALKTTPAYLMGWDEPDKSHQQQDQEDAAIFEAYRNAPPEIQQAIRRILER